MSRSPGRPAVEGVKRSVHLTTYITPDTHARMLRILSKDDSISNLLNDLLRDYLDECDAAESEARHG